jgi:hypothetical protein
VIETLPILLPLAVQNIFLLKDTTESKFTIWLLFSNKKFELNSNKSRMGRKLSMNTNSVIIQNKFFPKFKVTKLAMD